MSKFAVLLIFLLFVIVGCNKEDNMTNAPNLKSCHRAYLLFYDNYLLFSDDGFSTSVPLGDQTCLYFYDNDQIIRTNGGIMPMTTSTGFYHIFSTNAYDSISYINNDIHVFEKYNYSGSIVENDRSRSVYTLDSNNRIQMRKKKDHYNRDIEYSYSYSDNQIVETDQDGIVREKFYFENKNLTKVVAEFANWEGTVYKKKEILFLNYDNNPNPFKNLYHVKGAFYRAFSENNYQEYSVNEYGILYDGTYGVSKNYSFSMPLTYNASGYPLFGDYEDN